MRTDLEVAEEGAHSRLAAWVMRRRSEDDPRVGQGVRGRYRLQRRWAQEVDQAIELEDWGQTFGVAA